MGAAASPALTPESLRSPEELRALSLPELARFADEVVPYLKTKGIGAMNAGPFSARLLTNAPLPAWLKEPEDVKAAARAAAAHCASRGVDIAKLALQFALANPDITTTISGSANPVNIRNWAKWAAEPLDVELLRLPTSQLLTPHWSS